MQEMRVQEDPLEKEMATHSSILAWEIPRTDEPGGLQSMGSQRVNWWLNNRVLYSNRLIILFTQSIKYKPKKTCLIFQYSALRSTIVTVQQLASRGWHWGRKSYWLEEGEEVGDGRAEGSSDSKLQLHVNWLTWLDMWPLVWIFESLQLEGSYVEDFL